VFSTKGRKNTMVETGHQKLYSYIWGILKNKKCHLYRISGVEDHIHIITHIHPMVAPAKLVKDIKLSTIDMIKSENIFPNFNGWQDGYGAFTYSINAKNELIEYVKDQKTHHKNNSFKQEYISLLKEHGIAYNEKYLF